ncbi:MAG: HEPN domain-containing protein [Candidatus Rokubacteria bacterium]|nr:HEPN domain-containing protein [Candidatus Rokubacteria bacterium]
MPPDPIRPADTRAWLCRALDDLRGAEVDLAAAPPLLGDATLHCQEAVEKALHAFLLPAPAPAPDREPAAAQDRSGASGRSRCRPSPSPPRTGASRPAAGVHGGAHRTTALAGSSPPSRNWRQSFLPIYAQLPGVVRRLRLAQATRSR